MPPSPASAPALSQSEVRTVIIGLMLAILLGAIDQTIVSVSLPMMSADLPGVELLAWVVSGYLITVAVATPIYGKLGDLYGRRVMLSFAIGIFLLASVACALAQTMPMLVAARILQGIGGGGLISVAQAIIADVVAPRERGRYQGYISSAFAVASVSGPLAGGLLTQYLSWRWIFWINLPLGLAALIISRRALARLSVPRVRRPVDYAGAGLMCVGLAALLIGVTFIGQGMAWHDTSNLGLFAIALVAMAAFVWQEQRAVEPIVPLGLFRNATVAISCAILFIAFFQIVSLTVLIPLRLQMLTDVGADGAAYQLVPLTVAVPLGAYIGGRLTTRTGHYKRIQLVGTAIVPLMVLTLAFLDLRSTWLSVVCMAVTGGALGLQLPTSMVAVQNAVQHRYVGIATAVTVFARSLGAAVGIAILMAILLATLGDNAPAAVDGLTGAELIKAMVGETLDAMDQAAHLELTAVVQSAFEKVFMISAAVASLSFILGSLISDDLLSDQLAH